MAKSQKHKLEFVGKIEEKIMKEELGRKKKRVMKNKNVMVKSLERGPNLSRS